MKDSQPSIKPPPSGKWQVVLENIQYLYTTDGFLEFCSQGGSLNWKCKCMADDMEDMGISDLELPEGENKSAKA